MKYDKTKDPLEILSNKKKYDLNKNTLPRPQYNDEWYFNDTLNNKISSQLKDLNDCILLH